MHELSVAQSILDIAHNEMMKAKATGIQELELEIGTLSGIELESLQFALKALTADTPMDKMHIVVQRPEGRARCEECKSEFVVDTFIAQCPSCRGYNCKILQGRELRVKSIVVQNEDTIT